MFLKETTINGTKLCFEVSDKIVLLKEGDIFSDLFIESMKERVFDPVDVSHEIAYFDGANFGTGYTEYVLNYYDEIFTDEVKDKVVKSVVKAVNKFIAEFKDIKIGQYSFGFDKIKKCVIVPESEDDEEFRKICFADFVTANKLNAIIEKLLFGDGEIPIFIENVFDNEAENQTEFYLELIKDFKQVFISVNVETKNPLLENHCNKIILLENLRH